MEAPRTRPTYEAERDAAVDAARRAARLIRSRADIVDPASAHEKGTNDLVTRTDEEAQQTIVGVLSDAFPAYDIVAEEGTSSATWAETADGYRWIIDPLDGTTNFIYGVPPYAVSIALQHDEKIVVGVVLEVAGDELFTAIRGGGLHVDGAPAHVSPIDTLEHGLVATGFPYRIFDHVDLYLDVLGTFMRRTRGVRRHGSAAIDLAWLARGRFTGFFETGLSPWDVAAGALLVEEGGGRVTDYRDREAPRPIFERQILATNGAVHGEMLDILSSMRDVRA